MEEDNNFVEAIAQLAITCEKLGYHHESDEYIQKSINLAENIGNESSLAVVYNCAGILFKAWNKYDKATPFFEKALKIQVHLENQFMEAKILSSLAGCYNNTKKPDAAMRLLSKSISIKEKLEEGKSLAYSYAELGNTNVITGDLSEAILYFQKALGKFTYHEMDYFVFRNLIQLAQMHLDIGDDVEAERYLSKAYPICDELNESFMMGLFHDCKARLSENNGNDKKAMKNHEKSIHYFQECDSYDKLFHSLVAIGALQVRAGVFDKATWNFSKAEVTLKRISDSEIGFTLNINKLYLNCLLGNCGLDDCEQVLNELEEYHDDGPHFSEWWLMAKIFHLLKSDQKAMICQKKSQSLLKKCSDLISNKEYGKSFLTGDIIKKEIWLDLSDTEIIPHTKKDPHAIHRFCPNCGKANEGQNEFCSGCDQSLLK